MKKGLIFLLLPCLFILISACTNSITGTSQPKNDDQQPSISSEEKDNPNKNLDFSDATLKTIYFAGGCFWGVEAFFEGIIGVYDATSGYANGNGENPTYGDVMKGEQGFAETVEVTYDAKQVSLEALLDSFFMVIDPTMVNQQGNDIGIQYRTGIYYTVQEDKAIIQKRVEKEQESYSEALATEVEPLENYYLAEDFHQDYLEKNPNGYCHIDLSILDDINQ